MEYGTIHSLSEGRRLQRFQMDADAPISACGNAAKIVFLRIGLNCDRSTFEGWKVWPNPWCLPGASLGTLPAFS